MTGATNTVTSVNYSCVAPACSVPAAANNLPIIIGVVVGVVSLLIAGVVFYLYKTGRLTLSMLRPKETVKLTPVTVMALPSPTVLPSVVATSLGKTTVTSHGTTHEPASVSQREPMRSQKGVLPALRTSETRLVQTLPGRGLDSDSQFGVLDSSVPSNPVRSPVTIDDQIIRPRARTPPATRDEGVSYVSWPEMDHSSEEEEEPQNAPHPDPRGQDTSGSDGEALPKQKLSLQTIHIKHRASRSAVTTPSQIQAEIGESNPPTPSYLGQSGSPASYGTAGSPSYATAGPRSYAGFGAPSLSASASPSYASGSPSHSAFAAGASTDPEVTRSPSPSLQPPALHALPQPRTVTKQGWIRPDEAPRVHSQPQASVHESHARLRPPSPTAARSQAFIGGDDEEGMSSSPPPVILFPNPSKINRPRHPNTRVRSAAPLVEHGGLIAAPLSPTRQAPASPKASPKKRGPQ